MAAYPGNIGFAEMMAITMQANDEQQRRLDKIVAANDQQGFRKMVKEVLGYELQ